MDFSSAMIYKLKNLKKILSSIPTGLAVFLMLFNLIFLAMPATSLAQTGTGVLGSSCNSSATTDCQPGLVCLSGSCALPANSNPQPSNIPTAPAGGTGIGNVTTGC